jgi:beta-alanine--pyruvate transaminase
VFALSDLPVITDIRGYGMLAGFDLAPAGKPGARGYDAQKRLFAAGLHIKFTGDSGIFAPALVAEKAHIDEMCTTLRQVLGAY